MYIVISIPSATSSRSTWFPDIPWVTGWSGPAYWYPRILISLRIRSPHHCSAPPHHPGKKIPWRIAMVCKPVYSSRNFYYQYDDADSNGDCRRTCIYHTNSSNNNVGSGTLNAGTYQIVPSGMNFLDAIPNYTVQYENGRYIEVPALLPAPEVTVVNNCDGTSTLSTNLAGLLWSTGETTASITVQTVGTFIAWQQHRRMWQRIWRRNSRAKTAF